MSYSSIDSTSISNNCNGNKKNSSNLILPNMTSLDKTYSQILNNERDDSSSTTSIPQIHHRSFDTINKGRLPLKYRIRKVLRNAKSTPFSDRFTLLNKFKSRIIHPPKHARVMLSIQDGLNKYLSLPSVILGPESKLSSNNEENQNSTQQRAGSSSDLSPSPNEIIKYDFEKTMTSNDSLNASGNDQNGLKSTEPSGIMRSLSTKGLSINKFTDQLTQHARTVITKAPSIASLLTGTLSASNGANDNNATESNESVYWTEVFIERGKDLSSKDINGASDPYVKVFFGSEEKYTTNIVEKDLNPAWNEKFTFFVNDLKLPLSFNIFDHDLFGRDEPMGTATLDLTKIPLDTAYSATLELENERRNDAKTGLLKISLTITPKSTTFRDEVLQTLARQSEMRSLISGRSISSGVILTRRTIDVFIIQGRNLAPLNGGKPCNPYLRLKFGTNKKYRTPTIKSTTNPRWFQSFMYDTTLSLLPPIEFTLMDDSSVSGEFIGRGICNLSHLEEERTHRLPVELEDGAGIIDIFVTITGTTPLQEATNYGESSANLALESMPSKLTDEEIRRYKFYTLFRNIVPIFDIGRLEVKIYQARDLSSKDFNGKSDPFCVVQLDSTRLRTHTIYKSLNPVWNKSFVIPVQDIHSILELTIYDEDSNRTNEFIGKVAIPLLAFNNGEKKWFALKDEKCTLPVKGAVQIEATLLYTNFKAIIRTFNPRQESYYQTEEKFSVAVIKQHVARIESIITSIINVVKFINYCFRWENPWLSFAAFMASLVIVWNFELYMLPYALLILLARSLFKEYRRGRLGRPYQSLGDETISAIIQVAPTEEDLTDGDENQKEQKKSFMARIASIQDTILEVQGYIDAVASTFERVKNLFNFTVPWLSILFTIILFLGGIGLYYIPLRYLILAFVINKFTKRFRKPIDYVDNNEVADFMSRIPSDPEIMKYRELKVLPPVVSQKKPAVASTNSK